MPMRSLTNAPNQARHQGSLHQRKHDGEARGAKCSANTDLPPLSPYEKRGEAIDARRGQRQRHHRENHEQGRIGTRRPHRLIQHIGHRANAEQREIGVDRANFTLDTPNNSK